MYAAQIENGVVTQVIVGDAEWASDRLGGTWVGTEKLVGIGWTYDDNGFRPAQPYPSWQWVDGAWQAPVPYPDDDGAYQWDKDAQEWATVPPISGQE
jgi:hypothetical protein